jgi:hypothetical protein
VRTNPASSGRSAIAVEAEKSVNVSRITLATRKHVNLIALQSFAVLVSIVVPMMEGEESDILLTTALALLAHCAVEIQLELVEVPPCVTLFAAVLSASFWIPLCISWSLIPGSSKAFREFFQRLFDATINAKLSVSHKSSGKYSTRESISMAPLFIGGT